MEVYCIYAIMRIYICYVHSLNIIHTNTNIHQYKLHNIYIYITFNYKY